MQPIHGAASHGHVHIVQLLIDVYKIDPTVKAKVRSNIHTYIHINLGNLGILLCHIYVFVV